MAKPGKKPAPPPVPQTDRPGFPAQPAQGKANPRLQADTRWQRTKRYGWDGR